MKKMVFSAALLITIVTQPVCASESTFCRRALEVLVKYEDGQKIIAYKGTDLNEAMRTAREAMFAVDLNNKANKIIINDGDLKEEAKLDVQLAQDKLRTALQKNLTVFGQIQLVAIQEDNLGVYINNIKGKGFDARYSVEFARNSLDKYKGTQELIPGMSTYMETVIDGKHNFLITKSKISKIVWQEVMGARRSNYVTYWSVLIFLNELSRKQGFKPVYNLSHISHFTGNAADGTLSLRDPEEAAKLIINYSADGYRLPTVEELKAAQVEGAATEFYYVSSLNNEDVNGAVGIFAKDSHNRIASALSLRDEYSIRSQGVDHVNFRVVKSNLKSAMHIPKVGDHVSDAMWKSVTGGQRGNFVTYWSAIVFANMLSEQQGLQPAYNVESISFKGDVKNGTLELADPEAFKANKQKIVFNKDANGYRLPTTEEIEHIERTKHFAYVYNSERDASPNGPLGLFALDKYHTIKTSLDIRDEYSTSSSLPDGHIRFRLIRNKN